MLCNVKIAGRDYVVEFDYKITSHGSPMVGPSWNSPGEPAEPAEWEIDGTISLKADGPDAKPDELEIPKWLEEALHTAISEDEKVNDKIQEAADDPYGGDNYDSWRDVRDAER